MISSVNVINNDGQEIKVDVIMQFRIDEMNKNYIVYTINDDNKSKEVYISIAELEQNNGKYELKLIPEKEKNMVLVFYDNLRDTICGIR